MIYGVFLDSDKDTDDEAIKTLMMTLRKLTLKWGMVAWRVNGSLMFAVNAEAKHRLALAEAVGGKHMTAYQLANYVKLPGVEWLFVPGSKGSSKGDDAIEMMLKWDREFWGRGELDKSSRLPTKEEAPMRSRKDRARKMKSLKKG